MFWKISKSFFEKFCFRKEIYNEFYKSAGYEIHCKSPYSGQYLRLMSDDNVNNETRTVTIANVTYHILVNIENFLPAEILEVA